MRSEYMAGSKKNEDWASDVDVADPSPLPQMCGWKVLIRPLAVREKTKGGIFLPGSTQDDLSFLMTVGKVLAIGPMSFTRADMLLPVTDENGFITGHKVSPWFKIGDYVTYGKFAGGKRVYKGVKLLILNDDEVLDVVPDPSDIDPQYALTAKVD